MTFLSFLHHYCKNDFAKKGEMLIAPAPRQAVIVFVRKIYGDPAGRKCYEYFMGGKTSCPDCGIPKALKTKKPIVTEEILLKENSRPIQVTTIPFQNSDEEWLVAEVNVDISERKRLEEV
jgi:hypothetical protein